MLAPVPSPRRPRAARTLAACAAGALLAAAPLAADDKQLAGWIEDVRLGTRVFLEGKLDTGADVCSLDVLRIHEFKREGERWVRFWVRHPEDDDRRFRFERRIVRWTRIKRIGDDSQRRPVVRITLCLGDEARRVEFNLVDRSGFDYPVLIGRNFLEGSFLVDPEERHRLALDCPATGEAADEGGEEEADR